jgi:hypothetical protein
VAQQDNVSPEEPIFVLSSSQLQEIISRAVLDATEPLYQEIAYDRQRIAKLENPIKEPGKTELSRVDKIEKYLQARPDHRATFETLKGHLGINKQRLNEAIKTLMNSAPGKYGIIRTPGVKKGKTLKMLSR